MDRILKPALLALSNEVDAVAIASDCKHTAAWCLAKMPALYAQYQATNESRFGDEITRLVQALITELTRSQGGCKEAQAIATGMPRRFRTLHEKLGLPMLHLKDPVATRPTKANRKLSGA
jgi:hypothetical protein